MTKRLKGWGGRTGETPSGEKSAQPLDTVSLWLQGNAGEFLEVSLTMPALTGPVRVALRDVLVWSRTSSRARLPCCPLRGTGQVPAGTGRAAPGLWGGDGLCEPWQGAGLGTGRRCWQEQPHSAETRAGRDRELLPHMLDRGMWHLPAVPVAQAPSPSSSSLGSFPMLNRAPALIPRGLGCAEPLQQPEPREGRTSP